MTQSQAGAFAPTKLEGDHSGLAEDEKGPKETKDECSEIPEPPALAFFWLPSLQEDLTALAAHAPCSFPDSPGIRTEHAWKGAPRARGKGRMVPVRTVRFRGQ